jgi:ribosomal protein S19E (S16A)
LVQKSSNILKQIYRRGIVGVSRLRTKYGSKKTGVLSQKDLLGQEEK